MAGDAPSRRVLVVGGSPEPSAPGLVRALAETCNEVCAVDRGYDALRAAGVAPTLFCGDCDSVSAQGGTALRRLLEAGECDVERYNPDKDFTDLALALRAVSARWPGAAVVATCVTGGRPDHYLAALGCLARYDGEVRVEEDGASCRILHGGSSWDIEGARGRTFSLVALSPTAVVTEQGMKWELDHARCELLGDLGISNVVIGEAAHVACHEGCIAAFLLAG